VSSNNHSDDELVAFFKALTPEARQQYQALADLDRRFGEDVETEQRVLAAENKP